jgi:DNA invertase Pin-like site-specific DNA recombinase
MKSTTGRPRRATDEQIKFILERHAEYVAWLQKRPKIGSQIDLARHSGLSVTTVNRIIRESGQYKQTSPEERDAEKARRRQRMRRID